MGFGKLSTHGDFFRYNATGTAVQAFDKWIQEGIYLAQRQFEQEWEAIYSGSSAYHFLFYPREADQFLVGILCPSRDRSGRKFPFVISAKIGKSFLDQKLVFLAPLVFGQFLGRTWTFLGTLSLDFDQKQIDGDIEDLGRHIRIDIQNSGAEFESFLAKTSQGEFWPRIFSHFDDPRKFLILKNLVECAYYLRARRGLSVSFGLRFPLSSKEEDWAINICFWIHVYSLIFGHLDIAPVYFWKTRDWAGPNFLYFFFQKPSPKFFSYLVNPDPAYEGIYRLEEGDGEDAVEAYQHLHRDCRSALESEDLTLKKLMDRISA